MVPSSTSTCSTPGCETLTARGGRCPTCQAKADAIRGSSTRQGYGAKHRNRFRVGVLRRNPTCTCPGCTVCEQGGDIRPCIRPSTHADHWPIPRIDLVRMGLDADDPRYGRGLCARCDAKQTATAYAARHDRRL